MAGDLLAIYLSVTAVSLIALVGVVTLRFDEDRLQRLVLYLVSFSAGTLFGDTFLHILPETAETYGFDAVAGLWVLLGLVLAFVVEKYLSWRHTHRPRADSLDELSSMILFGDAVHNAIDGMILAASYLTSPSVGLATTAAIVFHEIPQEIGNYGVLIYGGVPRIRAILYNFLTALTAFLGATLVVVFAGLSGGLLGALLPLAAGNFVYIAGSDILPELAAETNPAVSSLQLSTFLFGIALMYALTF